MRCLVVMTLIFTSPLFSQYSKPNPKLTPGIVDATIEADLNGRSYIIDGVEHNICAPYFRTSPFRSATKSEKIKTAVCRAYGITTGCPGSAWELDDILPIEMGGKNVQANLWPQPIKEARVKDHQVEDLLGGPKGLICRGKISLANAQRCIITDWVTCAARVKTLEGVVR